MCTVALHWCLVLSRLLAREQLHLVMEISDIQKLGIGLGGFGVFFLLLGIMLFFDTGLLAIGNLFCIAGISISDFLEFPDFKFILRCTTKSRSYLSERKNFSQRRVDTFMGESLKLL